MKFIIQLILLFFILFTGAQAQPQEQYPFVNAQQKQQFQQLLKQVRCVVCQNQDIADSNADLAKDLRQQIYDFIQQNKSDNEILDYLTTRYGEFILFEPLFTKSTWLLWIAPFGMLLLGLLVLFRILRCKTET